MDEPRRDAARQQAGRVQRHEARRAEATFEAEAKGPEGEAVEEQVRHVRVNEATGDEGVVLAALHEAVRPQQVALDQRRPLEEARCADDDDRRQQQRRGRGNGAGANDLVHARTLAPRGVGAPTLPDSA